MERSVDRARPRSATLRLRPLPGRALQGPRTFEERSLPTTIIGAFAALLAIQILLAL